MSYNFNYNDSSWIEELLEKLDRKKVEVTFSPHLFDRIGYHNVNIDKVDWERKRNSYCNCDIHESFIEVRTVWPRKGR